MPVGAIHCSTLPGTACANQDVRSLEALTKPPGTVPFSQAILRELLKNAEPIQKKIDQHAEAKQVHHASAQRRDYAAEQQRDRDK